MSGAWPLPPDLAWEPLRVFWEGTAVGELRFPQCERCGEWTWYPQDRCRSCGGPLQWREVRPVGRLFAVTTVRHPFHTAYRPLLPLHLALVSPDDCPDVRLITRLAGRPDIGSTVDVHFDRVDERMCFPIAVAAGAP